MAKRHPTETAAAPEKSPRVTRRKPAKAGRVVATMTAGQALLVECDATSGALAPQLGVSRNTVACWRLGTKRPSEPARAQMYTLLGIPREAWSRAAGTPAPAADLPPATPAKKRAKGELGTNTEEVESAITSLNAELAKPGLEPHARARLEDIRLKAVGIRARLERDRDVFDARVVRSSPFWRRVKGLLIDALKPHPAAARAVAAALEAAEGSAQ